MCHFWVILAHGGVSRALGWNLSEGKCPGEIAETLPSNADDSAKEGVLWLMQLLEKGEFLWSVFLWERVDILEIIHVIDLCYLRLVDFMMRVDQCAFSYGSKYI